MTVSLTLFCLLVILGLAYTLEYDDCDAFYDKKKDGTSPGKCAPFEECPVLFDIIKSPQKTTSDIKMLQQLTCGVKEDDSPLVCCAVDDLSNGYYSVMNKSPSKGPAEDLSHVIVFGSDFPKKQSSSSPKETDDRISLPHSGEHPNFKLLPALTECSQVAGSDRILGGNETSILNYPWLARIGYHNIEKNIIQYLCAGTVINQRYILTAGHCIEEIDPDEYEIVHIRIGEKDRECDEHYGCSTPKEIKIEKVIPHPNYSKRDKSNDIGLIRLAEDISFKGIFTKPVCLPFVEEYGLKKEDLDPEMTSHLDNESDPAYVAGWGKLRWLDTEGSQYLQHVKLPVLSVKRCRKAYEKLRRVVITDLQICAGGERGKDSCGGDSGGGLFIPSRVPVVGKIRTVKWFQFGVVSFGPTHCGIGGLPGVYSNTYKYKKWILDQLKP